MIPKTFSVIFISIVAFIKNDICYVNRVQALSLTPQFNSTPKKAITKLSSISNFKSSISSQYSKRVEADPQFLRKTVIEISLAIVTQSVAEVKKRTWSRIIPEFDFVFAAILTAIFGKYYSMWRVAPTSTTTNEKESGERELMTNNSWRENIPTNAFQPSFSSRKIKLHERLLSFIVPMPSLFQAGFIASFVGYGITSTLIQLRSILLPNFISPTQAVNILEASIFTGCFVALVSNVRYQLLSGLIEPKFIHSFFRKVSSSVMRTRGNNNQTNKEGKYTTTTTALLALLEKLEHISLVFVRLANGYLGSYLAISGMKYFGIQKLK